ncbi:MAG: hypothetical protein OHK0013_11770 [Sandaracinaceae bacterium]
MFFGASAGGAAAGGGPLAGAPGGAPGAPGLGGKAGPDIIIVPLNFDAAAFGFSAVPQATHWVAVSVLGFPQFGQKTVTWLPPASAERAVPARTAALRSSPADPPRTSLAMTPALASASGDYRVETRVGRGFGHP